MNLKKITFLSLTLKMLHETSALKLQTSYLCEENHRATKEKFPFGPMFLKKVRVRLILGVLPYILGPEALELKWGCDL